jgi:hypothetical protein
MGIARGRLAPTCVVALLCVVPGASAQEAPPGPPTATPPIVSDATLARIKAALASEPAVTLDEDALRFYVQITATPLTFADYLKGSGAWFDITPTAAPTHLPGGARVPPAGGIDLLSLLRRANRAAQERRARQIREQIDRELDALEAANTAGPTP